MDLGLIKRNAAKGEWKGRRLGSINSGAIRMSIPTYSKYIAHEAKASPRLLNLVIGRTKRKVFDKAIEIPSIAFWSQTAWHRSNPAAV
jgi:hypothetical protein